METKKLTSQEIKEIRLELGLTQQQFADLLGLGDKTITRYETGASEITMQISNHIRMIREHNLDPNPHLRYCVVLKAEGIVEITQVQDAEDYKEMQALVGGYIEGYSVAGFPAFINEEGKLRNLQPTLYDTTLGDTIRGNVVVYKEVDAEGTCVFFTQEQASIIADMLKVYVNWV